MDEIVYKQFEFKWTNSQLPTIDGKTYKRITYSPDLAYNRDIPIFTFEGERYGCFYSNFMPRIQEIYTLDVFGLGRYCTFYFTSLEYDGNPFFIVMFVLIDTHTRIMYESHLAHRASDQCIIDIDPETNALTLTDGDVEIRKDEYQKKVGAAMICMDIMNLSSP